MEKILIKILKAIFGFVVIPFMLIYLIFNGVLKMGLDVSNDITEQFKKR